MKTYSLLRLEHGANKVIFTCEAESVKEATRTFNNSLNVTPVGQPLGLVQLNDDGYAKLNENISFCVAEHFEPFYRHLS